MLWLLIVLNGVLASRTLVILDSWGTSRSHSSMWALLELFTDSIDFTMGDRDNPVVKKYGEFLYDNIILAGPSLETLGKSMKVEDLISFFDTQGNLMLFGDTDVGSTSRRLANYFGFDFLEVGVRVYNSQGDSEVKTGKLTAPSSLAQPVKEKLQFTGTGLHVKQDSEYSKGVLYTDAGAYAYNEIQGKKLTDPLPVPTVGATQGRNNSRMTIFSSLDICSNKYWASNEDFCRDLLAWTFQAASVLRHSQVTHYTYGEAQPKGYREQTYTVKDHIYYSICIEELKNGHWVPFESDEVYLEFVMLDPKIRKYLKGENGTFSTDFIAPDVQGVYQFKAKFQEFGYSWVGTADESIVRHLRHDEYSRFLCCAVPYYTSVFASILGFLVFSFFFLYHKDKQE